MNLEKQVAIVTGSGRGIGRAIAQELARAGMRVAVVARTQAEVDETVAFITAEGGTSMGFSTDVTDERAIQEMVGRVVQQWGMVDLLVNNAAVGGPFGPSWTVSASDWWRCLVVNLQGPMLCASAVLPGMVARRQGRIVNVASRGGVQPWTYGSAYATSKAALIRFSENLAAETKAHGVAVFAICPGLVRTAMTEGLIASAEGQQWVPEFRKGLDEGYDVPPSRAAQLVRLLATGQADQLSGRFLTIDDNLDEIIERAVTVEDEQLYVLRLRGLAEAQHA